MNIIINTSLQNILNQYNVKYKDNYFEAIHKGEPGQNFPAISTSDNLNLQVMKWGFRGADGKVFNTADGKGIVKNKSFYISIRKDRCIIPVTGFVIKDYVITVRKHEIFSLAAVFSRIESESGIINCFAPILTESNELINKFSPVMPVILSRSEEDEWLKPGSVLSRITSKIGPFSYQEININDYNPVWDSVSPDKKIKRNEKKDNNIDLTPWHLRK